MASWEMDREQRLEQFSFAYVRALAAALGMAANQYSPDRFGVDLQLSAKGDRGGPLIYPKLDIQIKATSRKDLLFDDGIHYPLEIPHYDALRDEHVSNPRILVVVLVPEEETEWIRHSREELALRRCGYWRSLLGMGPSGNTSNVTVCVSWDNILSVDALNSLMAKVSRLEPL
jgi:hypothetical protein